MKNIFVAFLLFLLITPIVLFLLDKKEKVISPISEVKEKPLEKYSFENLKNKEFKADTITIGKVLKEGNGFISYIFYFNDQNKLVSGLMNLPSKPGTYPVLAMFRGFVEKEKYTIGEGTRHSGEVFAQNGFITLAPDFLGYGESDNPSNNSIEERFQTYTTALSLLASIKNLNPALEKMNYQIKADVSKVGIWGHSNGGHIALSVLAITSRNYPTVLWAPVSKPFPYSILYFTDEFNDHGKALRKVIADFEKDYDIEKYSPVNFYNYINAPIQLHQGTDDEAVPKRWSDQLYAKLKNMEKNITNYNYLNDDHNFSRGSWETAVQRSILFYKTSFK